METVIDEIENKLPEFLIIRFKINERAQYTKLTPKSLRYWEKRTGSYPKVGDTINVFKNPMEKGFFYTIVSVNGQ